MDAPQAFSPSSRTSSQGVQPPNIDGKILKKQVPLEVDNRVPTPPPREQAKTDSVAHHNFAALKNNAQRTYHEFVSTQESVRVVVQEIKDISIILKQLGTVKADSLKGKQLAEKKEELVEKKEERVALGEDLLEIEGKLSTNINDLASASVLLGESPQIEDYPHLSEKDMAVLNQLVKKKVDDFKKEAALCLKENRVPSDSDKEANAAILTLMGNADLEKTAKLCLKNEALPPPDNKRLLNMMAKEDSSKLAAIYKENNLLPSPAIDKALLAKMAPKFQKLSDEEVTKMAGNYLSAKMVPPLQQTPFHGIASQVMGKMAQLCAKPGNIYGGRIEALPPESRGAGGVYMVKVDDGNKATTLMFLKRPLEEPGMKYGSKDTGVGLGGDPGYPPGGGPLREHIAHSGPLGFRLTAFVPINSEVLHDTTGPEEVLITDGVLNSTGSLQPMAFFKDAIRNKRFLLENAPEDKRKTKDEQDEIITVFAKKIQDAARDIGMGELGEIGTIYEIGKTLDQSPELYARIDKPSLRKLILFQQMNLESDANEGNVLIVVDNKDPQRKIYLHPIDAGMSRPTSPPEGVNFSRAFYSKTPVLQEKLTEDEKNELRSIDVDHEVKRMRKEFAGKMKPEELEGMVKTYQYNMNYLKDAYLNKDMTIGEVNTYQRSLPFRNGLK